jgi:hypothetical protein
MLIFLAVSVFSFLCFNRLGFFLSKGPHMENYNGPKSYVALHVTNYQKIGAAIRLGVGSAVIGAIVSFLI